MAYNKEKALKNVEREIRKFDKKLFKLMFFVIDSKGAPVGELTYIYETAYKLKERGYKVQMLYADKDFVGVESWLGKKYAELPHFSTEKDALDVSPSDILFIPEVCTSVMAKVKDLPCTKVAILQNFDYLVDTIPFGASWETLKIRDCVTTSESLKDRLLKVFPSTRVEVVRPSIAEFFKTPEEPKKLIVNIISKDPGQVNSIVKPFLWKYPIYNWVSFREVKNLPREDFANALQEAPITIWCDTTTDFGASPLEAMACGNIVIGKIPENEPEWMLKDGNLRDNGVWFYKTDDVHEILANVIQSFLTDSLPENIFKEMKDTVSGYAPELQDKDIDTAYIDGIFARKGKELQIIKSLIENNNEEEK